MKLYGHVGGPGRRSLERSVLPALNGTLRDRVVMGMVAGADVFSPDEAQIIRLLLRNSLRNFVDAWINSAKTDERELPSRREVQFGSLVEDYVRRNAPILKFSGGEPCLLLIPRTWERRSSPTTFAMNDLSGPVEAIVRKFWPAVSEVSLALYLELLDSPERIRVFRCDGCRAYFMNKRRPKIDVPIYRGCWCPECKEKGSARRVADGRAVRKRQLTRIAAEQWCKWDPKRLHRYGDQSEWVAAQVNRRIPARWKIARNWVTRNRREIEAEVRRREHAAG